MDAFGDFRPAPDLAIGNVCSEGDDARRPRLSGRRKGDGIAGPNQRQLCNMDLFLPLHQHVG